MLARHYLRTLALEEEECGHWPACRGPHEQGHGAAWGSLAPCGDALGPSSTWRGADAADARLRLSAQHLSPCTSMLKAFPP